MLSPAPGKNSTPKVALNHIYVLMWGAVAMLVLLAVLAYGTYANFLRLSEANKLHVHTYEVLSQVSAVRGSLGRVERHLRGYAINGNVQFITNIKREDSVRRTALKKLDALTADQAVQQERLADLKHDYDDWYKQYVEKYVVPGKKWPPGLAGVEMPQRRESFSRLENILNQLENTEQSFLANRIKTQVEAQRNASTTILIGGSFAIIFATGLLVLLGRTASAHERASRELKISNTQLNEQIVERLTANEKARASEQMYRHLAEDSLDLIARHSPEGRFTYVSPASQRLIGFTGEEMLGLTPIHFLSPKEKKAILHWWQKSPQQHFSDIMEGTSKKPLLRRYVHKDGHELWLETIGHAIFDVETGELREWHSTSRDVSSRVQSEENRKRMATGLRSIVEATDELLLCPDEVTLVRRSVDLGHQKLGLRRCNIYLFGSDGKSILGAFEIDSPTRTLSKSEAFSAFLNGTQPLEYEESLPSSRDPYESLRENWDEVVTISASSGDLGVFCYDRVTSGDSAGKALQDAVTEEIVAVFCSMFGTLLERERTQSRWRESRQILQTIVDNAPMMLYAVDRKGFYTVAAGRALKAIGFDAEANIGRNVADTFDSSSDAVKIINRVLAGESMHDTMHYGDRYLEIWREPIIGTNGQIEGALGVGFDNTERALAEMELRDSLEMQRAILEGASYSIVATDADGTIRVFNGAAENMLGHSATEVVGHNVNDFFNQVFLMSEIENHARDLSRDLDRPIAASASVLVARARAGLRDEFEWTNIRKDGTKFPVRMAVQAMRDNQGSIMGYVAISYDLTDSRRAEKLKNEFVSIVSHELRTPLTSIRGSLGLMQGGIVGVLPPGAKQMIDIAAKNADRLVLLINDILDIEKIESDQMRFEFGELSLEFLLRNAIEANRAYGESMGVQIQLDAPENLLENLSVYGDEARLMQVLTNFLSNACKFSPEHGTVWIGAKRLSRGRARIWVSDEGTGIPTEFEAKLFERFMQADSSATRKKGGTGLGLAIAKAIVEKHGGRIGYLKPYAAEAPNPQRGGATFYFDLDLISMNAITPNALPKILVCEDDEDVSALLKSILVHSGYDVELAPSLAEARAKLMSGENYFAMTLDLELPDGNGVDLLRELRESSDSKALRDLPVLVVSAHCESGKLLGSAFDVVDWLQKPFEPIKILECIARTKHVGKSKILHVEDDADVRRVTELILSEAAQITPAASLYEARVALKNEQFDLALIDVGLPDGSGLELISALSVLDPPVPVVLFSAREDEISHLETVAASLTKSRTTNAKLRETVEKLIGQAAHTVR